jgi:hypothetical protein
MRLRWPGLVEEPGLGETVVLGSTQPGARRAPGGRGVFSRSRVRAWQAHLSTHSEVHRTRVSRPPLTATDVVRLFAKRHGL